MRHLEFTERALQDRGVSGLERLPVRVVAKALAELENLVRDWSAVGLAELRSRMAVMVKSGPADEALEDLPFDTAQGAVVTEVEHSVFEASQRQWTSDDGPTLPASPRHSRAESPALRSVAGSWCR
jgi:hypothetical protein